MADEYEFEGPHSKGVAFGLWLSFIFGFFGLHRFYLGRPWTGLLYLFTFGLGFIGQIVDLIRLPALVAEENRKYAALRALEEKRALQALQQRQLGPGSMVGGLLPAAHVQQAGDALEKLRIDLVKAAAQHGGKLSVTQGVLATGKGFAEVEKELDEMVKSGYVGIDNDEKTGIVVYTFRELDSDLA